MSDTTPEATFVRLENVITSSSRRLSTDEQMTFSHAARTIMDDLRATVERLTRENALLVAEAAKSEGLMEAQDKAIAALTASLAERDLALTGASGHLRDMYTYFQGPQACGNFTCNCGSCGLCEFRSEIESVLASLPAPVEKP